MLLKQGPIYIALAQYVDQAGLKLIDYPISLLGLKAEAMPSLYVLLKLAS